MKFNEHTKLKLDKTCTVFFNHKDTEVSSLPSKTINNEIYYLLAQGDTVKVLEGAEYEDGDKLYLKEGARNEIIKEDYDHWRAMTPMFLFDKNNKNKALRCNNIYIRCW